MYRKGMSREEARTKLRALIGGPYQHIVLKNENDGEEVILSNPSVGKMLSAPAVRKSEDNGFTKEQHCAVASDIGDLFGASFEIWSHPDKNGNDDITIHRYAAPLHFGDAVAYITVKESVQDGKRIYSAELMEIGKLGGTLEKARGLSHTPPSPSFKEDNIRKLFDAVKKASELFRTVADTIESATRSNPDAKGASPELNNKIIDSPEKVNRKNKKSSGGPAHDRAAAVAREAATRSADTLIRRSPPMFDKIFLPSSLRGDDAVSRLFSMFLNQHIFTLVL